MTPAKIVLEPSTWAGLGLLLQAVRFIVPPQWQLLIDAATGILGTRTLAARGAKPGLDMLSPSDQWQALAVAAAQASRSARAAGWSAAGPDADHGSTSTVVWRSIDRPSASKGARPATSATFTLTEPVCRLLVSRPMPDANTAPVGCVSSVRRLAAPTLAVNDGSSASPR